MFKGKPIRKETKTTALILAAVAIAAALYFTITALALNNNQPAEAFDSIGNQHSQEAFSPGSNQPIEDAFNANIPASESPVAQNETSDRQPIRTLTWNGYEIAAENFHGRSGDVNVPENVLTTEDQTLTVFFSSGFMSDAVEYGITEIIQVKIDGQWYSIPVNLSRRETPLILEPPPMYADPYSDERRTEHTVDLSITGGLPPGQYRLVARFFVRRIQYEYHTLAYFWIIEPGGGRPPESETSGPARAEDIIFRVEALSEARRVITDMDDVICMFVENLSGKDYTMTSATLEMKQGDQWMAVQTTYSNLGLMQRWHSGRNLFYLDEPLQAGTYRIRISMLVFGTVSNIEPEYEFSVIPYKSAPEPSWDVSRLSLSRYDASRQSGGVRMTLANTVLDGRNTSLEYTVTADAHYFFGEVYTAEVLLYGDWYSIPFAYGNFIGIGYSVGPAAGGSGSAFSCNPVFSYGILPAGQYRIIKEFDLYDPDAPWDELFTSLAKEFATVEFTVAETLDSVKL